MLIKSLFLHKNSLMHDYTKVLNYQLKNSQIIFFSDKWHFAFVQFWKNVYLQDGSSYIFILLCKGTVTKSTAVDMFWLGNVDQNGRRRRRIKGSGVEKLEERSWGGSVNSSSICHVFLPLCCYSGVTLTSIHWLLTRAATPLTVTLRSRTHTHAHITQQQQKTFS